MTASVPVNFLQPPADPGFFAYEVTPDQVFSISLAKKEKIEELCYKIKLLLAEKFFVVSTCDRTLLTLSYTETS